MKLILDIPDEKSSALIEVLRGISFVKLKPISAGKAQLMQELSQACEEMREIQAGKKQARRAQDFLQNLGTES